MDIPKHSQRPVRTNNPITTDPALTRLLEESKSIQSEEQFKGWKDSFLKVYKQYLDPAGIENAHMSDKRLLRSMEKLAATVVSVKDLVNDGKITAESQSVMGKRALTNMTDQMAKSEQEIARFMPTTAADEETVGYDKFELGAVMIDDGFYVYELLKTTKDITVNLQDQVLNDVLPSHQQSIIQFYLRQIQSFCDVMADLGLFRLMEDVMELYKIRPRTKKGTTKKNPPDEDTSILFSEENVPEEKPTIVELDPDKVYNFRTEFTNGYIDPFSGTAPGSDGDQPLRDSKKSDDKGDNGDNDFIIYFDMKTGCIGKIPRKACIAKSFIVSTDENGKEIMDGEIDDDDEKEKLIWDMKKAMKNKTGGSRRGVSKSPGNNKKQYVITPKKTGSRTVGRTQSGDSKGNLRGLQAPRLDMDDNENMPANGDLLRKKKENISISTQTSSALKKDRKNEDTPSDNGWSKTGAKSVPTAKTGLEKKSSFGAKAAKPPARTNSTEAPARKSSLQKKVVKDVKPSNDGWASASTMAAARRKSKEYLQIEK